MSVHARTCRSCRKGNLYVDHEPTADDGEGYVLRCFACGRPADDDPFGGYVTHDAAQASLFGATQAMRRRAQWGGMPFVWESEE